MDSLVILIVLTTAFVGFSIFLADSFREKAGKDIHNKNDAGNFLVPVAVMVGIYVVAMFLKEIL